MVRTRVGYAGGTTPNPTYHDLGDHSETIQIDFDPTVITYEQLLEQFWTSHDPCGRAWSRQYMSAIFVHDETQRAAAERTRDRFVGTPDKVLTEIAPLTGFWPAEDYHQKYRLQGVRQLADELRAYYPESADFVASTAAARINGFLGGHGTAEQLDEIIGELGLSPSGEALLRRYAR